MLFIGAMCCTLSAFSMDQWRSVRNAETLSVYLNNKPAGEMMTSLTVKGSSVIVESMLKSEVSGGGLVPIVAAIKEIREYDSLGSFIKASQEMSSPAGKNLWSLDKSSNGQWRLKVTTGGVENSRDLKSVNDRIVNTYLMYQGIKKATIKPGGVWNDTILELTSGEPVNVQVRCVEVPGPTNGNVWTFTERNSINEKDEKWVIDREGKTVYREVFPFVAKRKNASVQDTGTVNIFETFMIPKSRAVADNENVLVAGDESFNIDKSVMSFYRKTGSKYLFKRTRGDCTQGKVFTVPDSLNSYVSATPTMQVDHPDIKKLAGQFAQSSPVCERIKAMNDYVFTTLKKEYTATFSSALETYKAGFGDCGEHAVLLAALLRASGIPARVVFGVVYMPSQKGYFYHAWVLAFDGNKWIFSDPAFGVFPANKDRLPLLIDDSGEKLISLARVIGRLKIDYITNK
jgi:hypothetical protein